MFYFKTFDLGDYREVLFSFHRACPLPPDHTDDEKRIELSYSPWLMSPVYSGILGCKFA